MEVAYLALLFLNVKTISHFDLCGNYAVDRRRENLYNT